MNKLITILIILLMGAVANAQTPDNFTYQSVIRNNSGGLVTFQLVSLKVSILKGSATGTAEFVERHTAMTNANGLVTVSIGSGSIISGAIADIKWGEDKYFLQVEIDPTGGSNYTISGATQIQSVPYASHARTTERMSEPRSVLLAARTTDAAMTTATGTITMQTTITLVGSNILRLGSDITLKKGHLYRCTASLMVTMTNPDNFSSFKFYNNTTSSWIGVPGTLITDNRNNNEGSSPRAVAYIDLTNASTDQSIRLRHFNGVTYSTIWGAANQTYCECMQID